MGFVSLAEVAPTHVSTGQEGATVTADDIRAAELASAGIAIPDVLVAATLYLPDGITQPGPAELTEAEQEALGLCFALGRTALEGGNPPIGAVLLDNDRGLAWAATTTDKTNPDILGHAEVRAYNQAKPTVGDQLQNCTLVTTAQPCNTCTCPYAEGQIGRIVFAAPRPAIYAVSGLMRPRGINMPDLLSDGNTKTLTVQGHLARNALVGFATWGALRNMRKVNI